MGKKTTDKTARGPEERPWSHLERISHGQILAAPDCGRCLDTAQLSRLEESFRQWAQDATRADVRLSRRRILLIFLLIRWTGARLHEVLALDPFRDISTERQLVIFGRSDPSPDRPGREVHVPAPLAQEICLALKDASFTWARSTLFQVDPGHVRRKFYDRAQDCGFPKELGGPDALRRSRAVELLRKSVPLPVVQRLLGHSSPNLTAAYVTFSEAEVQQVAKFFLEKESGRKTSARNTFFGKISTIRRGDIQARVDMITPAGDRITTVITHDSLTRLGLKVGKVITAEVKAPWVILYAGPREPRCSADNRLPGTLARIVPGRITTEYVIRMRDGTEVCALVTEATGRSLACRENDPVWVTFNSFAVVLRLDS